MAVSASYIPQIIAQSLDQLSSFIPVKLTTKNYFIWKEQIPSVLEGQRIDSHILDEPPCMPSNDTKRNESYIS